MNTFIAKDAVSRLGIQPNESVGTRIVQRRTVFEKYREFGCNSFILPITSPEYKLSYLDAVEERIGSFPCKIPFPTLDEIALSHGDHIPFTIGKISSWMDLNSDDYVENDAAFQVLEHEIEYGQQIGVFRFLLKSPEPKDNLTFAHNLALIFERYPTIDLIIQFSIGTNITGQWLYWNMLRKTCNYNSHLKLAVELPTKQIDVTCFSQWWNERATLILVPLSIFQQDLAKNVSLHKCHDFLLFAFVKRNLLDAPKVILADTPNRTVGFANSKSPYITQIQKVIAEFDFETDHVLYDAVISRLIKASFPIQFTSLKAPYDLLTSSLNQRPNQSLEGDDRKYEKYLEAMIYEIQDISMQYGGLQDGVGICFPINVLFLGSGNGTIINKFFEALEVLGIPDDYFYLTAIEKKPTLANHLQKRNIEFWDEKVLILNMDVREYTKYFQENGEPPVQLVISDLIGSFGCNELIPEYFDSVANLKVCEDEDCVFIPRKVESYIQPVYAPKLWKFASEISLEKMYVPMIPDYQYLDENPKALWSFTPKPSNNKIDIEKEGFNSYNKQNSRISSLDFDISGPSIIHGFAGFFKATLSWNIEIDNFPESKTILALSWLPAFFPLEKPLGVNNSTLKFSLRRVCSLDSVWYEWSVDVGFSSKNKKKKLTKKYIDGTKIHNLGGKEFKIPIS